MSAMHFLHSFELSLNAYFNYGNSASKVSQTEFSVAFFDHLEGRNRDSFMNDQYG